MERAKWVQLDKIEYSELEKIPQIHYDNLVKNISELNDKWVCVDPSKSSNFFYNDENGFILIDLSTGTNKITKDMIRAIILWRSDIINSTIEKKINVALSKNNI